MPPLVDQQPRGVPNPLTTAVFHPEGSAGGVTESQFSVRSVSVESGPLGAPLCVMVFVSSEPLALSTARTM